MRHRQEVLNVLLAQLLQREGLVADPEVIVSRDGQRSMPDVLVNLRGLRTAIEGDFSDKPDVHDVLLQQTISRVDTGIAHIGVGVVYPADLRSEQFNLTPKALDRCRVEFALVSESQRRSEFAVGSPHDLAEALRRLHEDLGREDALTRAVAVLHAGIETFVASLDSQEAAVVARFAETLSIRGGEDETPLNARQRLAVRRIATLIITNALLFHEALSAHESRIRPLADVAEEENVIARLTDTWRMIVDEINYYPIFHLAIGLMRNITRRAGISEALRELIHKALRILDQRGALRHDLMGRIYHRLLEEAKHLGAFYTSVPAATLLLKLALRPEAWPDYDWSNLNLLQDFQVADLACGTGTLLMASAEALTDNYVHACYDRKTPPDLDELHSVLLKRVIWGYDVLASAVHLTASTLALRNPSVMVQGLNLFSLPLGGPGASLGSLEFVAGDPVAADSSLFAYAPRAIRAAGRGPQTEDIIMPSLSLCVMNPPFTRSVGGNLLFGNLPPGDRARMQRRLGALIRTRHLHANATAGLGSPFVATAHPAITPGGRLALVLPRAVLGGVAWAPTRRLIAENYHLEYVVVSHDPEQWNFSENTNLSEALLVARRRSGAQPEERTVFINLWHNPRNSVEALSVAWQTQASASIPDLASGAMDLTAGSLTLGQAFAVPWSEAAQSEWGFWSAFAQADLVRTFSHLQRGRLFLPGRSDEYGVPLVPLRELAVLGPDARDIHDAFARVDYNTPFASFWSHDTHAVISIAQTPNAHLSALAEPLPGRPLRRADDLWPHAARLLLGERLRLNTVRAPAVLLSRDVLSNVWWTISLLEPARREGAAEALALWFNSTLGLITLIGQRSETAGAWCKFKKPVLGRMPVFDVSALDQSQLGVLARAYRELSDRPLLTLPEITLDEVRAQIDSVFQDVLDLPDLSPLRESLSWEPVICQNRDRLLNRQRAQLCLEL